MVWLPDSLDKSNVSLLTLINLLSNVFSNLPAQTGVLTPRSLCTKQRGQRTAGVTIQFIFGTTIRDQSFCPPCSERLQDILQGHLYYFFLSQV